MAARAAAFPGAEIWDRFRCSAERHIDDGNLEAGERLWEIVDPPDAGGVLTIRSTGLPSDSIECALDIESGNLTCASMTFQVLRDQSGMFRRGGKDYTIDEAVNLILDELVRVDLA